MEIGPQRTINKAGLVAGFAAPLCEPGDGSCESPSASDDVRKLGRAPRSVRIAGGAALAWGGFLGLGLIAGQVLTQAMFGDPDTVPTLPDWTAIVALVVVGRGLLRSRWWAGIAAWATSVGLTVFGIYWAIWGFDTGPTSPDRLRPFQTTLRKRVFCGLHSWCQAFSSRPCCYRSRRAHGFDRQDERAKRPAIRSAELDSGTPNVTSHGTDMMHHENGTRGP